MRKAADGRVLIEREEAGDPWVDLLIAVVERAKADAEGLVGAEPDPKWRPRWRGDAQAFLTAVRGDPSLLGY